MEYSFKWSKFPDSSGTEAADFTLPDGQSWNTHYCRPSDTLHHWGQRCRTFYYPSQNENLHRSRTPTASWNRSASQSCPELTVALPEVEKNGVLSIKAMYLKGKRLTPHTAACMMASKPHSGKSMFADTCCFEMISLNLSVLLVNDRRCRYPNVGRHSKSTLLQKINVIKNGFLLSETVHRSLQNERWCYET